MSISLRLLKFGVGFSNESDKTIFNLEEDYNAHHYELISLVVRHTKGCWITNDQEMGFMVDFLEKVLVSKKSPLHISQRAGHWIFHDLPF